MMVLLVKCLLMIMPFKLNTYQLLTGQSVVTTTANAVICGCFCIVTCVVSIIFPNIKAVLGIFGGLCSVNLCFLIPLYIYLKLRKDSIYCFKNMSALIYFSVLIVSGWVGALASIYDIFKN
jgi:hypothetical protein